MIRHSVVAGGMNCSLSQDVLKLGQKIHNLYHWDQQLGNFTNGSDIVIILGNADLIC